MTNYTIKINDKEYTKEELINEVIKQMECLPEGTYKNTPDDLDNFYTNYSFKKIK